MACRRMKATLGSSLWISALRAVRRAASLSGDWERSQSEPFFAHRNLTPRISCSTKEMRASLLPPLEKANRPKVDRPQRSSKASHAADCSMGSGLTPAAAVRIS